MDSSIKRKGARSRAEVTPEMLQQLHLGQLETATLSEMLAMDFYQLMHHSFPEISPSLLTPLKSVNKVGVTTRMQLAGTLLYTQLGLSEFDRIACHPSDTIRGWAAYMLAAATEIHLTEKLERLFSLAKDAHFGVREWAWLALRADIANHIQEAIIILTPWTRHSSEAVRRFAIESTRPRGVWCKHITLLKEQPELGLPLLESVKADPAKYVQDSVSNWLNDAAKSQPNWVTTLCQRWQQESPSPHTQRICLRAQRSLMI